VHLDEPDFAILRALFRSSGQAPRGALRVPLAELCRTSGLHANSVARRLQALRRGGVLGGTYFDPRPATLGLARGGFIFEGTRLRGIEVIDEAVAEFPSVETVISAHGVVMGHLWGEAGDEVDATVERLRRALGARRNWPCYNTARFPPHPADGVPLSKIDRRLILALRSGAGRPTSAVARGIGVTSRTLQRRADRLVGQGVGDMRPRFHPGAVEGAVLVDYFVTDGDQRALASLVNAFPDRLIGPFGAPACVFVPLPNLQETERRRAEAQALPGIRRLETFLVEDVVQPARFEEWLAPRVASPPRGGERALNAGQTQRAPGSQPQEPTA
jgi:DNA-binding Lrp family transcriptional regulator